METAVILLTMVCYGAGVFLWWYWKSPVFVFALLAGHLSALVSPLWPVLYGFTYTADLPMLSMTSGIKLVEPILVASAWFYTLPALVVLALYLLRIWTTGYFMALIAFTAFVTYHLLIEVMGLNRRIWVYNTVETLPLGIANWMLSTIMAALISLSLLYILLLIFRFSWITMFLLLLPAPLLFVLVIRGLLGAPLWISLLLNVQSWAASIGIVCTIALLVWAVHIVALGISRVDQEIVV